MPSHAIIDYNRRRGEDEELNAQIDELIEQGFEPYAVIEDTDDAWRVRVYLRKAPKPPKPSRLM